MKAINIYVEDEEFIALHNKKGDKTWREFLLSTIDEFGINEVK